MCNILNENDKEFNTSSSQQLNAIWEFLLTKEDLLETFRIVSNRLGFDFFELQPRIQEDFGKINTPNIIMNLRFRNHEAKRIKRFVKLLRELKQRKILFYFQRNEMTIDNPHFDRSQMYEKVSIDPSS